MHKLAITVLAAVVATIGLAMDANESRAGNDGRGGEDRYLGYGNYYSGYYGGYRARRHWRRHQNWYGPRYVVRRDYYRSGNCMRRRFDAYGNVYFKVRRACRW